VRVLREMARELLELEAAEARAAASGYKPHHRHCLPAGLVTCTRNTTASH
jgi:hypothetical protein